MRRTRLIGLLLVALVAPLAAVAGSQVAQAATYACVGAPADEPNGGLYPEPRIFLENQAWWQPTVFGTENHGHIHSGACVPRTHHADGTPVKVSGTLTFPVRTILHENPGLLRYARVHMTTASNNHQVSRMNIGQYCTPASPKWSDAVGGCTWWTTAVINTTVSAWDGYQEFRLSGNVQHDGSQDTMFSSGGWQIYLENGKPIKHMRAASSGAPKDHTEAKGWYLGANYINARIETRIPYTVSGNWTVQARLVKGAGGIDPTHGYIAVDPNFHFGDAGIPIYDGPAPYSGPITIDTTTLSNGLHRLFLRTDAPCDGTAGNNCGLKANGASNNVSTDSGGLVIPFVVAN